MRVRNLIEASADVVTITTLKRGDVYKRVVPAGQFSEAKMQYGVVTSVMNNGEQGAIQGIEYALDYSAGVVAKAAVFDSETDVALFAAQPEEVREHIAEMRQAVNLKVREAEQKLGDARSLAERTAEVLDGVIELSKPDTTVRAGAS